LGSRLTSDGHNTAASVALGLYRRKDLSTYLPLKEQSVFSMVKVLNPLPMVHVLIVDDDEDDRDLLTIAIHELDPKVNCILARNGEEALQGLRQQKLSKPDLIFLDLNMPRISGVQFLRELKADRSVQDIPVVIYTTSKQEGDLEMSKKLGAVHFLTKPTSFTELCRMIADVFAKEMIHLNS
jgi:CheY-like chemotaxis protein